MASLARTFALSAPTRSARQAVDPVLLQRADHLGLQPEIGDRRHHALGHGVHHARLGKNVDESCDCAIRPRRLRRHAVECFIPHRRHDRRFDDAVGEQFQGDPLCLAAVPIGLDQVAAGGGNLQIGGQSQFSRRRGDGPAQQVGLAGGRIDVNFPKHLGSSSP